MGSSTLKRQLGMRKEDEKNHVILLSGDRHRGISKALWMQITWKQMVRTAKDGCKNHVILLSGDRHRRHQKSIVDVALPQF